MDLLLPLDRAAARPLRDQLYDGLRRAILDGRLPAASRLPASRTLAAQLGVARFTVDDAYGRLAAEGYVVGRRGSGTYVSPDLGAKASPSAPAGTPPPFAPFTPSAPSETASPRAWSAWGRRLPSFAVADPPPPSPAPIVFRSGVPALDALPWPIWNRLRARAVRDVSVATLDYGAPAGHPDLRHALAAYLARSRGISASPEATVVTSGTRQALDLLARLWLDPGDAVAIEEPGYPAAHRAFAAAGARLCPVPVDADGLRVDLLDARAPDARLVYVTPSHQYPTGAVLSLSRRRALLAWAAARGALIVEDDYDGEFRYGARPIPALAGLDAAPGSVVYLGTFSKVLYPALRLGYALLPQDMADRFVAAKALADHHSPTVDQIALAGFVAGGHFERHLARMRRLYAVRRAALVDALAEHLPDLACREPRVAAAGLHLLVGFDVPGSEAGLVARAAGAGVGLDPAGPCFLAGPPPRPTFLLGYASLPEARIAEGVRRLADVLSGGS